MHAGGGQRHHHLQIELPPSAIIRIEALQVDSVDVFESHKHLVGMLELPTQIGVRAAERTRGVESHRHCPCLVGDVVEGGMACVVCYVVVALALDPLDCSTPTLVQLERA